MRQAGRRYWPLAHLTKGHPLNPAPRSGDRASVTIAREGAGDSGSGEEWQAGEDGPGVYFARICQKTQAVHYG